MVMLSSDGSTKAFLAELARQGKKRHLENKTSILRTASEVEQQEYMKNIRFWRYGSKNKTVL